MTSSIFGTNTFPNLLNYAVGANGILSFGMALFTLLTPLSMLSTFGITATSTESRKVARDLFITFAARDMALGFGLTSAAYYGHREIMGWSMIGVAAIAALDGWVTRENKKGPGPGREWQHWSFVGLSLGLAAACFGYV